MAHIRPTGATALPRLAGLVNAQTGRRSDRQPYVHPSMPSDHKLGRLAYVTVQRRRTRTLSTPVPDLPNAVPDPLAALYSSSRRLKQLFQLTNGFSSKKIVNMSPRTTI
jgi:hypothetical protein